MHRCACGCAGKWVRRDEQEKQDMPRQPGPSLERWLLPLLYSLGRAHGSSRLQRQLHRFCRCLRRALSCLGHLCPLSLPPSTCPYPTFSGTAALSAAASPPSFLASSATALADRSTDSHPAFSCAQASRDSASTHGCSCSQQPPLHMGGARAGKNCLKARPPPLCSCTRFGRRHCALSHISS